MPEVVIEQQFSADLAGERVGWVAIRDAERSPGVKLVDVATGIVGPEGAQLSYEVIPGVGTAMLRDEEGFEAGIGLYAPVEANSQVLPQHHYGYYVSDGGQTRHYLVHGNSGTPIAPEQKVWAAGNANLMVALKSELGKHGLSDVYPQYYYALNNVAAITAHQDKVPLSWIPDLLIPDGAMQETTARQLELGESVVGLLMDVKSEDEVMKQRLSVFSDVTAEAIPDVFVESREQVADFEQRIKEILPDLFASNSVYAPIGRGFGREWPYMDPEGKTPQEAYGIELKDLKEKKVGRSAGELERELSEVRNRMAFAQNGVNMLRLLLEAESLA